MNPVIKICSLKYRSPPVKVIISLSGTLYAGCFLGYWEQWGVPVGCQGRNQGLSHFAVRSKAARAHWGSPIPEFWSPPWVQDWAKAGLGHGYGRPDRAGLWGVGNWP